MLCATFPILDKSGFVLSRLPCEKRKIGENRLRKRKNDGSNDFKHHNKIWKTRINMCKTENYAKDIAIYTCFWYNYSRNFLTEHHRQSGQPGRTSAIFPMKYAEKLPILRFVHLEFLV